MKSIANSALSTFRIAAALLLASCLWLPLTAQAQVQTQVQQAPSNEPLQTAMLSLVTVNINTAGAQMLSDILVGVGPAKAQAIIDYREQNGPFQSIDELVNVRGIGLATLERNRPLIEL